MFEHDSPWLYPDELPTVTEYDDRPSIQELAWEDFEPPKRPVPIPKGTVYRECEQ